MRWLLSMVALLLAAVARGQVVDAMKEPVWGVPGFISDAVVRDASGQVADGINSGLVANASWWTATGGAAQVLATGFTPTIQTGRSFTAICLARSSATNDASVFGSNIGSPGALIDLGVYISTHGAYVSVRDDDSSSADTANVLNLNLRDGQWHAIAGVFDAAANTLSLIVDGQARTSIPLTVNSTGTKTFSTALGIGGLRRASAGPLRSIRGDVAAAAYFPRALSEAECAAWQSTFWP